MSAQSALKILCLLSVVMSSLCYVYIIPPVIAKSKDHEGFCYYEDSKSLIKTGDAVILPTCERVSCSDDYFITVAGCGTFSLNDPKCLKWERDYSKPYPGCCNEFICVEPALLNVDPSVEKNTLE